VANAAAISGSVTYAPDGATGLVSVSTVLPDPHAVQQITAAFAQAYISVLQSQSTAEIASYKNELGTLAKRITSLSPSRPGGVVSALVSEELTVASQSYGSVEAQIVALETAPPPATVYAAASAPVKTGTSKKKVLILAGVAGLLAGIGIVLVWERADTRLRKAADVADSLPVLAELPFQAKLSARRSATSIVPVVDAPSSLLADRFRELRTVLQPALASRRSAVVLVTSPESGDGKSFVVANLAASWALSGRRVVAVSTDLRRPRLDALLGSPDGTPGLSSLLVPFVAAPQEQRDQLEVVAWTVAVDEAADLAPGETSDPGPRRALHTTDLPKREDVLASLVDSRIPGLTLLPTGPKTAVDPGDLLASEAMQEVILHLRRSFDVVVIDTPALSEVSDAGTLASMADGVIVVARANRTSAKLLQDTVGRLAIAGARMVGVVVNLTSPERTVQPAYRASEERSGSVGPDAGLRRVVASDSSSWSA
ncbi:MAG: tyrosine-protein kinase domain-containing protein, partial [Acidimicrobiales bacterium]